MSQVNLDALIPREDFISDLKIESHSNIEKMGIGLEQLLYDKDKNLLSIYHLVRKPDFQRETNEWSKEKICDLIECFMEKSFIPSIITWSNKENNKVYIIDGAHRLSALIAYINDDYGDQHISQQFYGFKIPPADLEVAQETRDYINGRLGSFESVIKEGSSRSNALRINKFLVQNIDGDVTKAEDSFFKINEQGVVISPTEKELCKNRHKPTCIATRAIMKGGAGNQYWKLFKEENQCEVKSLAEDLHTILFEPKYEDETSSIYKDHPLGGAITTGMPMVYELMKILKKHEHGGKDKEDKSDGASTIAYLSGIKRILKLILGNEVGSLGLHPTIYFYDGIGTYIHSAFMGVFKLMVEKENDTDFKIKFTVNRARIENYLIKNKIFLKQINSKKGSKERSAGHMKWFFENIINYISENDSDDVVTEKMKAKYNFLNEKEIHVENHKHRQFTTEVKSEATILSELQSSIKCTICKGTVHPLSKDFDHTEDFKDGGKSTTENAGICHFYCNNSKDKLRDIGFYKNKQATI